MTTLVAALMTLLLGHAWAAPARASTTFTVRAGTPTSGSTTFTGATTGTNPEVIEKDLTTGITLTCAAATIAGNVPHLGQVSGAGVLVGTRGTWANCTGPLSLSFTESVLGTVLWNATSQTASVTAGYFNRFNFTVGSPSCSFTLTGAEDGSFNTSTQLWSMFSVAGSGHVLTSASVSGCFGMFGNGDQWSISLGWSISTALGRLSISSP